MGMTIAEPIQTLEYLRDSGVFPFSTANKVIYKEESIDVAIDTMRKYQKIEQILKDIPYGGDVTVRRIQEVVEDGNDD